MTTNPSISNPEPVGVEPPADWQGFPGGLPDPAVLARLANEFFAALPGGGPGLAARPPTAPDSVPTLPPDASGFDPALRSAVTASAESAFYFLDAVQPASPRSPQTVVLAPRSADPNFLPDLGFLLSPGAPSTVPGSRPAVPTATAPPRHLETAGSPLAAAGKASDASFYFLDESRSIAGGPLIEAASRKTESGPGQASGHPGFDVLAVRRDFPILQETVHGKPLIWLDNAATTQKPQAVIDRLAHFYQHENSNIHRAAHELAARATDAYEAARDKVARFLRASSRDEIVFVRGATEAINLVAQSWGRRHIGQGDEIVITWLEHHANIVPWQQLCAETGARLRVAPVDDHGQVRLDEYERLFNSRTRLAAFTQVSNALGTVTPVKEMVEIAHRHGARVLVDGAQAVSHLRVDVRALDCDWYVFSGHKVFGPTGIGVLYGKLDLLNAAPPWQGGGNMIQDVTFERTLYHPAPARFEAGTGNIADAVGLGAALDYVERIGLENIGRYEHELLAYATRGLEAIPGLRLIGTAPDKAGVLSFVLQGFRSEEVGQALNREGIAVRSGHHCAQPILRRFGQESTVRPSLAFYNTCEEIDALVAALRRIQGGRYAPWL
jgi:cysteine desulfurase/selenocysteine lyase